MSENDEYCRVALASLEQANPAAPRGFMSTGSGLPHYGARPCQFTARNIDADSAIYLAVVISSIHGGRAEPPVLDTDSRGLARFVREHRSRDPQCEVRYITRAGNMMKV